MTHKYVFVAVGAPACGKSAFYHKIADDGDWGLNDKLIHVSSDKIREELFGSAYDQSDPERVFKHMCDRAEWCLINGFSVYLDSTHAKKEWRKYAIDLAQKWGAVCVAIYFAVPVWTLWSRDRNRERSVGFKVLWWYMCELEPPTKTEGFDGVFRIDKYGEYDGLV